MPQSTAFMQMRMGDLLAFLAVKSCGSFTGAARELGVTPSHVSKAVTRLEVLVQARLLSRGAKSVSLSVEGRRVAPVIEQAVTQLRLLGREDGTGSAELTVAAPSWLVTPFLPVIAAAHPEIKVRGLELPPTLIRGTTTENFFDITFLMRGTDCLPDAWVSTHVGEIRQALFGRPELARALGPGPISPNQLRDTPFISPIYRRDGQFVTVDDDCPLALAQRRIGHQAQTIGLALELATVADQVVFGPWIAARRHLQLGALVEIPVQGWSVNDPLYLVCNGDRVLARVQRGVAAAVREALAA